MGVAIMWVPQNGWCMMKQSLEMDNWIQFGGTTIYGNPQIPIDSY